MKQLFYTSDQSLDKIPEKDIIFSKVAGLSYDKVWNCKGTSWQVFFDLLNHICVLEQLYFCRTYFDSYFSYSAYLLYYTMLNYTILYLLYYTILYYTTLCYAIPYYTILYHIILYYTILFLAAMFVPCQLEADVGK